LDQLATGPCCGLFPVWNSRDLTAKWARKGDSVRNLWDDACRCTWLCSSNFVFQNYIRLLFLFVEVEERRGNREFWGGRETWKITISAKGEDRGEWRR